MENVRLGIIGYGNMGTTHADNILKGKCPDIKLVAIADHKPNRLEAAKEIFGEEVNYFENAIEMLDSGLIVLVL